MGIRNTFLTLACLGAVFYGCRKEPAKINESPDANSLDSVVKIVKNDELVPIDIKLPTPMFTGTPENLISDNLEKVTGKKRGPFYAPKGVKNLALGKIVSGSCDMPIEGELEQITDGDKEAPDGSYVILAPFSQYVQIDLEKKSDIYAITVWHYHMTARIYRDIIVQTADDEDFITNVHTLFNNDHDNTSGQGVGEDKEYIETNDGKLIDAKGVQSRYIRLYSNGCGETSDLNEYIEVEAWGLPSDSETPSE